MSITTSIRWLVVTMLCAIVASAHADVPASIPFQAAVKTAAGAPLPDSPIAVVFNVYNDDGGLLWTNSQTLTPSKGVISARIPVPDSASLNQRLLIGVKIGSDPEMSPRLPLAAAPYALALPNVAVDRATGVVGIGAAPDATAVLTVGGMIRSATGGIRFPDGTTQATAQVAGPQGARGPMGPVGPPGPVSTGANYPSSCGLDGPRLRMKVDGTYLPGTVTLAQPFVLSIDVLVSWVSGSVVKEPGPSHIGPLVLTRAAEPDDTAWSDWATPASGQYPVHNVELSLYDRSGTEYGRWSLPQCLASKYAYLPNRGQQPLEQISLIARSAARTKWVSRPDQPFDSYSQTTATLAGIQGDIALRGSTGFGSAVVWVGEPPSPHLGNLKADDFPVGNDFGVTPDLYPWFTDVFTGNLTRKDAIIKTVDQDQVTLASMTAPNVWPCSYGLVPTSDAGVVEEVEFVVEKLDRAK